MISGSVSARRAAIVPLRVHGPNGSVQMDCVLDTGFTAFLTMSSSAIERLGLSKVAVSHADLADGKRVSFDVFEVDVEWVAGRRTILVFGLGDESLIGMRLLWGCKLSMDVDFGGTVTIA